MISEDILRKLTNAYIMYEIASHGVDPREKIEGTTMRIDNKEGYKYRVIHFWEEMMTRIHEGQLSYVDAVLWALPGVNLVSYRQKGNIENRLREHGNDMFENALRGLYEGNEDRKAFDEIVKAVGGYFDVLGFLFFQKNPNEYMPIRSDMFDERLHLLGVDSHLSHNCTWENYQLYNGWIEEIFRFLQKNLNKDVQKIDAHSFLWVVPGLLKYMEKDVQVVEHNKFGKGIVIGFERDLIKVKFGNQVKNFDRQDCFNRGIMRLIPVEMDIDGYEEAKNETDSDTGKERDAKPKPKKQFQPIDEITRETNDELDRKLLNDLNSNDGFDESLPTDFVGGKMNRPDPVETNGRMSYSRNPVIARRALAIACYKCEINPEDPTFIRRNNGKPYTEPHHLVPMAFQNQFDVALDREENIVSLCSNCHNEIHYGQNAAKLIEALYSKRKNLLESIGVEITLDQLKQMY